METENKELNVKAAEGAKAAMLASELCVQRRRWDCPCRCGYGGGRTRVGTVTGDAERGGRGDSGNDGGGEGEVCTDGVGEESGWVDGWVGVGVRGWVGGSVGQWVLLLPLLLFWG